jgi:hypothetical protein
MKVAVWDTYVSKKDGTIMHFDIIVPQEIKDPTIVYNFGKAYLKSKDQDEQTLSANECRFCHIENIKPKWEKDLNEKGYHIVEMENCM